MPVTRATIANATANAFTQPNRSVGRDEIVAAAVARRTDVQVLYLIRQLPDRKFEGLDDLWDFLQGMPVG